MIAVASVGCRRFVFFCVFVRVYVAVNLLGLCASFSCVLCMLTWVFGVHVYVVAPLWLWVFCCFLDRTRIIINVNVCFVVVCLSCCLVLDSGCFAYPSSSSSSYSCVVSYSLFFLPFSCLCSWCAYVLCLSSSSSFWRLVRFLVIICSFCLHLYFTLCLWLVISIYCLVIPRDRFMMCFPIVPLLVVFLCFTVFCVVICFLLLLFVVPSLSSNYYFSFCVCSSCFFFL